MILRAHDIKYIKISTTCAEMGITMLTPIDIQNHSLKTAVRGYSKKETDDFLEEILSGYEELYKENRELKDKLASLSEGIQYYKQMETTLQKALVLAEKTSTETQEAAKSKADAMTSEAQTKADALTREAQTKADAILEKAETEAASLRKEAKAYAEIAKTKANQQLEETRNHVRKLVQSYENYRLQFKKLAESQIEMLESDNYSIFAPELSEMLDDAPDAGQVMDVEKLEAMNLEEDNLTEPSADDDVFVSDDIVSSIEDTKESKKDTSATDEVKEIAEDNTLDDSKETIKEHSESYELAEDTENTEDSDALGAYLEEEVKKAEEKLLQLDNPAQKWQSTTPKLEGAEEMETKSVMPNSAATQDTDVTLSTETEKDIVSKTSDAAEDTPFTFIDTE